MNQFLWGALAACAVTAGLFFLKFWSQTRDRLFAMFAAAFFVFSLNWVLLALAQPDRESQHIVYLVRLVAFALIIVGIVDKNRRPS